MQQASNLLLHLAAISLSHQAADGPVLGGKVEQTCPPVGFVAQSLIVTADPVCWLSCAPLGSVAVVVHWQLHLELQAVVRAGFSSSRQLRRQGLHRQELWCGGLVFDACRCCRAVARLHWQLQPCDALGRNVHVTNMGRWAFGIVHGFSGLK